MKLNFIDLGQVLKSIADAAELVPHIQDRATNIGAITNDAAKAFWDEVNPKIEWARHMSYAAAIFNKALHDSFQTAPAWFEYDENKGFPVRAENAKTEGVEILTHATRWGNRKQDNCCTHFRNSITLGNEALLKPVVEGESDGLTKQGGMLRLSQIGFNRAELIAFLNDNGIQHTLAPINVAAHKQAQAEAVGDAKPTGVYADRDKDFIAWINDDKPSLTEMTKPEIQGALIKRNGALWRPGFADWWKHQKFHKGKQGRRKRNLI